MSKKVCQFCEQGTKYIDYKNPPSFWGFTTRYGKIRPKYYSGNCLRHQKMLANAIKKARIMALIQFVR